MIRGRDIPNWTLWVAGGLLGAGMLYFGGKSVKNWYHNRKHPAPVTSPAPVPSATPTVTPRPTPAPLPRGKGTVCSWINPYLQSNSPVQVYDPSAADSDDISSLLAEAGVNTDAESHIAYGLDSNPDLVAAFKDGYTVRSMENEMGAKPEYLRVVFAELVPKPTPTPAPTPEVSLDPEASPEASPSPVVAPTPASKPNPYADGIQVIRTVGYVQSPANPDEPCFVDITNFLNPNDCSSLGAEVRDQHRRLLPFVDAGTWNGNTNVFNQWGGLAARLVGDKTHDLSPASLAGLRESVCQLSNIQILSTNGGRSLEESAEGAWFSRGPASADHNLADYFTLPVGIPEPLNERP